MLSRTFGKNLPFLEGGQGTHFHPTKFPNDLPSAALENLTAGRSYCPWPSGDDGPKGCVKDLSASSTQARGGAARDGAEEGCTALVGKGADHGGTVGDAGKGEKPRRRRDSKSLPSRTQESLHLKSLTPSHEDMAPQKKEGRR